MTRVAVLGDIHGNLPALEAVIANMQAFQPDVVVANGDLINWGPFSRQVLQRVAEEGWAVIRGNHELYLLDYGTPRAPDTWSDSSRYPLPLLLHEQLAHDWLPRIAAWPDTLSLRFPDAPPLRIIHGSARSPWEPLHRGTAEKEAAPMLAGIEEVTVATAHTHIAMDRQVGKWRVLNPGSVGVPLNGKLGAEYMLLDGSESDWQPQFRHVPYDYSPVFAEFERQHFVERCGIIGHLVVDEFRTARCRIHPFLGWHSAECPDATLSMGLLEGFEQADLWKYTSAPYRINMP